MDYSVDSIDITDRAVGQKICRLLSETFGSEVTPEHLAICTTTNSNSKSLYLAAVQDDEIIGFNAFISHDLVRNDSIVSAFQSCWTATSRDHRGKRIFQNLINEAKIFLKERGAAFIFGFPNENSQTIFTKKLGFREIPSLKWQVPNLPGLRMSYVTSSSGVELGHDEVRLEQNDRQLIEMKSIRHGSLLVTVETEDGVVWGVKRERMKAGIPLKYCEIGGVRLANRGNPRALFQAFFREARGKFFQLTTTHGNTLNPIFRRLTSARTNDLIVFDLNMDTSVNTQFDFFGGVKDVF